MLSYVRGPLMNPCPLNYIAYRSLTSSQVAVALRPFYFRVHPDFFGKYPEAKEVNEQSLKTLNGYLDSYLCQKQTPQKTRSFAVPNISDSKTLKFFVRNEKQSSEKWDLIEVKLRRNDALTTIRDILESCRINTTDLLPQLDEPPRYRSEDVWDIREVRMDEKIRRQAQAAKKPSLSAQLKTLKAEVATARKKFAAYQSAQTAMINNIKSKSGIVDIHWSGVWSLIHFRSCLQGLQRLVQKSTNPHGCLAGETIYFGAYNGRLTNGAVGLCVYDVSDDWVNVITQLESVHSIQAMCDEQLEISEKLFSIAICLPDEPVPISLYRAWLKLLLTNLRKLDSAQAQSPTNGSQQYSINLGELRSHAMNLQNSHGALFISQDGTFQVPYNSAPSVIRQFISCPASIDESRSKSHAFVEDAGVLASIAESLMKQLGMASPVRWDTNLAHSDVIQSLQLLRNAACGRVADLFRDEKVFISRRRFAVQEDGTIDIPVDWWVQCTPC